MYTAATPWALAARLILDRTSFFHHRTRANHGRLGKV
jgi:hypothetical protein